MNRTRAGVTSHYFAPALDYTIFSKLFLLSYLNFLSLPFERMTHEQCWMFAPKNYESRFFQYYLHHAHRPALTLLTLETDTLPTIYNLAKSFCSQHKIVRPFTHNFSNLIIQYSNRGFLTRAVPNSLVRQAFDFKGLLHVFHF